MYFDWFNRHFYCLKMHESEILGVGRPSLFILYGIRDSEDVEQTKQNI